MKRDHPLTIVQFWDSNPPPNVLRLMETWRLGPCRGSFNYQRFDEHAATEFIRTHFDRRTLNAFLQCAVPAMKADVFRYCYLYACGGIYVDADISCSRNLLSLCAHIDRGLLFWRTKEARDRPPTESPAHVHPLAQPGGGALARAVRLLRPAAPVPELAAPGSRDVPRPVKLPNSFLIVANVEDELLRYVLEKAITNIERRVSNNVWIVTGPGIMSSLYNSQIEAAARLFAGFTLVPESELRRYVKFCGGRFLSYKRSGAHWTIAQKSRSIFRDPDARD